MGFLSIGNRDTERQKPVSALAQVTARNVCSEILRSGSVTYMSVHFWKNGTALLKVEAKSGQDGFMEPKNVVVVSGEATLPADVARKLREQLIDLADGIEETP